MRRREFLKSMTALAAGSALPAAPAVFSPAVAQSRAETLLIVSESGPNNLDIHGVGTNVPGYEASWNCYDRLISHEMKTLPNGPPVAGAAFLRVSSPWPEHPRSSASLSSAANFSRRLRPAHRPGIVARSRR